MNELQPSTLTATQRRELLALVVHGIDRLAAIDYVGADYVEVLKALQGDHAFADDLARAERQFELTQLRRLNELAEKHWHVAAWLLERRFPDRYARGGRGLSEQAVQEICHRFVDHVLKALPERTQREAVELELRQFIVRIHEEESDDID